MNRIPGIAVFLGGWYCVLLVFFLPTVRADNQIVVGGSSHTLALKTDGTVWAWGDNTAGQLGDGTDNSSSSPVLAQGLADVTAIAAGSSFSVALKADGTVWTWGDNQYGQLGDNSTTDRSLPGMVPGLTGVTAISAFYKHVLALKNDGTVWAWGQNVYGQLGYDSGATLWATTPRQVASLPAGDPASAVVAGYSHSIALVNGSIWTWGGNQYGQLGLGDNSTADRSTPVMISALSSVSAVAASYYHTLALKNDGTVWAWGRNQYGQLGDNSTADRKSPVQVYNLSGASAITVGIYNSTALKTDGTVWAWGLDNNGELGFSPTDVCGKDVTEPNCATVPGQVQGIAASSIASGYYHELATTTDGDVLAWGGNEQGQLGFDTGDAAVATVPQKPQSAGDSGAFNLQTPTPTVNFTTGVQSVAEDADNATIIVTLDAASKFLRVEVPYTVGGTASGSDHDLTDGSFIIPIGQKTAAVSFKIFDDTLDESDETVIVTMGVPVNAIKGQTAAHTVTIVDNDGPPPITITGAPSSVTNVTSATLTVSGVGLTLYKYKLDAGDYSAEKSVDESINLSSLGEGVHTVAVIRQDAAGNWQQETVSWTVDLTPPAVEFVNPPAVSTFLTGITLTVDDTDVVAYKYKLDAGNYSAEEEPVTEPITATNLDPGIHTVAVVGRDAAGNWQSIEHATDFTWEIYSRPAGDINADGVVDLRDAVLGLQAMAGKSSLKIYKESDLNNDSRIGLAEVLYALRYTAK